MGAITSSLGISPDTSAGQAGVNYKASAANISSPANQAQADTAYQQTQTGLQQQNAFLQALQAQNGVGNQSQIFNQLSGIANGTGPNPALAQLANSTGANVSNQAALMASQRGAGANIGLLARQAAQQGGNLQQQAAGQGAALQAQQQLSAINAAGGLANNQVAQQAAATQGYSQSAQNQQQNILNALGQFNTANVQNVSSQNAANSSLANGVAQNQQGMVGGAFNAVGMAAGLAHGGMAKPAYASGGKVPAYAAGGLGVDTSMPMLQDNPFAGGTNSPYAQRVMPQMPAVQPGLGFGVESQTAPAFGLGVDTTMPTPVDPSLIPTAVKSNAPAAQPANDAGQFGAGNTSANYKSGAEAGKGAMDSLMSLGAMMAAHGGKVPAVVSPGEIYVKPNAAKAVAKGKASAEQVGEKIPGKAKVKGDSLKNDTVPKNLDEGGIVIPRSIVEGPNAQKNAAKFVAKVLAGNGPKPKAKKI